MFSRFQADCDDVVQMSGWGKSNIRGTESGNIVPGVFTPGIGQMLEVISTRRVHVKKSLRS